uniref:Uncharacterized protein n=1 Tax=Ignisphaera aggregans TaxID=334771 RepID=A0A7C4FC45_9CREN
MEKVFRAPVASIAIATGLATVIERDLTAVLRKCLEILISLNPESDYTKELHDAIRQLEKTQQFLLTRKIIDLLSKLYSDLQSFQDAITKDNLRETVARMVNSVRALVVEFQLVSTKMILLLSIITLSSMSVSMASLYYALYNGLLLSSQLVFAGLIVFTLTIATMIAIHLKLMISLILQSIIPALSASYVTVMIAVQKHVAPALMILATLSTMQLFFSLYFLTRQSLAYRKAIILIINMHQVADSIRVHVMESIKRRGEEVNEEVFKRIYGHEYLELIKYVRSITKIS